MNKKIMRVIYGEALFLALFIFFGGILMLSNTGFKSFRYPLSHTPREEALAETLGKGLLFLGYPGLCAVRFLVWRKNCLNRNHK